MRYLIISNYGTRLGVSGALLTVHENTNLIREIPLSRLRREELEFSFLIGEVYQLLVFLVIIKEQQ